MISTFNAVDRPYALAVDNTSGDIWYTSFYPNMWPSNE